MVNWTNSGFVFVPQHLPLAQAPATATTQTTGDSQESVGDNTAKPAPTDTNTYHAQWNKWLTVYSWQLGARSVGTALGVIVLGFILIHIFRRILNKYLIARALRWATLAVGIYSALIALHPVLMTDPNDIITVTLHKTFVAVILLVGIRLFDRLVIVPVLTRGGKVTLSRFIHQIILAVITIFLLAEYIHWAFGLDISSLLTGTAVISIVLGLALQETLGNFFSGLVLQASVPFQPGDWIQIGDMEGRVVEMTWRAVTILTGAGNYVLIPNSAVAKDKIVNFYTPTKSSASSISVGLEYATPPHEAKRVLLLAVQDTQGILKDPAPSVAMTSFDASAVMYKIIFWINEPQSRGGVENALRMSVWYRLKQAGLNIPFNITTIEMTDVEKRAASEGKRSEMDRLAAVSKSEVFASLSDELKKKLAGETSDFHLAAGQSFYHEGDAGDSMFILLEGSAEVFAHAEDGKEVNVGNLDAGATFGEISAMTGQSRVGTIRAKTDVRAMEITRDHLQDLFQSDPGLMAKVSEVVAKLQKQHEEAFKKLGAKHADDDKHTQSHSVLERMKSLFSILH